MNELTLEEQKLLTESIGDCYHEYKKDAYCQFPGSCTKCDIIIGDSYTLRLDFSDFSDWRVVGRLIALPDYLMLTKRGDIYEATFVVGQESGTSHECATRQLAITRAILAYLKEKENEQTNHRATKEAHGVSW